jgi:hypothetical protein
MKLTNSPKLAFSLLSCVCVTVLMAVGSIDAATGMPFLTLIAGYILGNGVAAKNGDPVEPIIGRKKDDV